MLSKELDPFDAWITKIRTLALWQWINDLRVKTTKDPLFKKRIKCEGSGLFSIPSQTQFNSKLRCSFLLITKKFRQEQKCIPLRLSSLFVKMALTCRPALYYYCSTSLTSITYAEQNQSLQSITWENVLIDVPLAETLSSIWLFSNDMSKLSIWRSRKLVHCVGINTQTKSRFTNTNVFITQKHGHNGIVGVQQVLVFPQPLNDEDLLGLALSRKPLLHCCIFTTKNTHFCSQSYGTTLPMWQMRWKLCSTWHFAETRGVRALEDQIPMSSMSK